jgi:hypothetical protein
MAYVTVSYERWAAGREKHRQEQEANYAARRRELLHSFTADLGAQMADLSAAEARAEKHLQLPREEELAPLLARLEAARESVRGLHKDYEGLRTRLSTMPTEAGWENAAVYHRIERDIQAFRDQLEPCLERLRAELVRFEEAVKSLAPSTGEGEVHCIACGRTVPEAPFCQQCGSTRPAVTTCVECGERIVIPLHLLAQCEPTIRLFCTGCGARVTAVLGAPRASDPAESPHGSEGI